MELLKRSWLEIEAGSSGNPNQAPRSPTRKGICPLVMQIPGIDPEFLARDLLHRLDDKLDLTQAFKSPLPWVPAMGALFTRARRAPWRRPGVGALAGLGREVAADAGAGRRPERASEPATGRQLPAADARTAIGTGDANTGHGAFNWADALDGKISNHWFQEFRICNLSCARLSGRAANCLCMTNIKTLEEFAADAGR